MQDKYMLPLMPISVVLTKARPEFCLQTNHINPNFKFEITKAILMLRRVKVLSTYKLRLENELAKRDASYGMRTFSCRPFTLDAGLKTFTYNNIFSGNSTIPDYCCIGMVRSTSYSGSWDTSPYNFEHFGLEEISIGFDQYRFSYEPQYTNNNEIDYAECYNNLFEGAGSKSNNGLSITMNMFTNGWAIYTFHFNREESLNCDLWNNKIVGSARLTVRFNANVDNPALTILVYSEENQMLKVTSKREVIRTYNI